MENINKKRYWLRGGLLGLVLAAIFTWIPMVLLVQNPFLALLSEFLYKIMQVISHPVSFIFCKGPCVGEAGFVIIFSGPITGILIGVIAGLIYGKIKNRKSSIYSSNV